MDVAARPLDELPEEERRTLVAVASRTLSREPEDLENALDGWTARSRRDDRDGTTDWRLAA